MVAQGIQESLDEMGAVRCCRQSQGSFEIKNTHWPEDSEMAYCRNGNIFKRDDTPNAANECPACDLAPAQPQTLNHFGDQ